MKKLTVLVIIVTILAAVSASAQQKLILVSAGYIENHHSYTYDSPNFSGLPSENFTDKWKSWGLGSVQFISHGSKPIGLYNSTLLFFLEQLVRTDSGSSTSYDFKEFRLGLNNIVGFGANFGTGRLGFLIGGGLHTDFVYINKYPNTSDSNYFFLNLGLGGGGHVYFMINETINIHAGTVWWWDPFQVRSSSNNAISNNYSWENGWGYNITVGIGFKLTKHPS